MLRMLTYTKGKQGPQDNLNIKMLSLIRQIKMNITFEKSHVDIDNNFMKIKTKMKIGN